jgi:hypothetical protein
MRRACRFWLANLNVKRPLGRYRCEWEDNIKMDLNEIDGNV